MQLESVMVRLKSHSQFSTSHYTNLDRRSVCWALSPLAGRPPCVSASNAASSLTTAVPNAAD